MKNPPKPDDLTRDADWPKRTPDRLKDLPKPKPKRGKKDA